MLEDLASTQTYLAKKSVQKITNNHRITWLSLAQSILINRKYVLASNVCAIVSTSSRIAIPLLIPFLVDEVVLGKVGSYINYLNRLMPTPWQHPAGYIAITFIIATALRLLALTFGVLQNHLFLGMVKSSVCEIRTSLLTHIEKITAQEYRNYSAGKLGSRLMDDIARVEQFLGRTISELLISILSVTGIAVVILSINLTVGALIIVSYPIILQLSRRSGLKLGTLINNENAASQQFHDDFIDTYNALLQLRVIGRLHFYFDQLRNRAAEIRDRSFLHKWKKDSILLGSTEIFHSGIELILYCVLFAVSSSYLTLGEMVGVSAYLWAMLTPCSNLLSLQYDFYSATDSLKRVNEVLALETTNKIPILPRVNHLAVNHSSGIVFDNVEFSYRDSTPILRGLTLNIDAGEKVALIGPSGCGKSTIIGLILGLYVPNSGRIFCAGMSIDQIKPMQLSQIVHGIMQEPAFLNRSIRENITLGRHFPEHRILQVLQDVGLSYLFDTRGFALDSLVGGSGLKLSGGERQRIILARVILADPEIILLDEATSALDPKADKLLQSMILRRFSDRTIVIITHRPSTLEGMDKIFEIRPAGDARSLSE